MRKNWSLIKLFRASNFLEFMWPSFALSQIFGLFPYKLSRGILRSSIPGYVYSAVILTLLTLTVFNLGYCINFTENNMNYESLPALLQADCYLLLGYLYSLTSFFCSDYKLRLFDSLAEASQHVKKLDWNKSARLIHGKDVIGFLFLIAQMPNTLKGGFLDVFVKLVCSYVTLIIYLLDNQFVNCVLAIRLSFERINSDLRIIEEKFQKSGENCFPQFFVTNNKVDDSKRSNFKIMIELRSLRKKYEDLCAVVKLTNDAFSVPVIISLGLTFAEVTFSLYFYILKSIGAKEINLEKQIWYHYFITSAAYYTSKFLVAVWACETTKDEAEKTRIIVHRILTRLKDKEVTFELQSFSLQMIQRNVSFSVHGISLDGQLVAGIGGGISTYLLILIQFLTTSNKCDIVEINKNTV